MYAVWGILSRAAFCLPRWESPTGAGKGSTTPRGRTIETKQHRMKEEKNAMKKELLCGLYAALLLVGLSACSTQADQPNESAPTPLAVQAESLPLNLNIDLATETVIPETNLLAKKVVESNVVDQGVKQTVPVKYGRHAGSPLAHFVTDGQFFYYIQQSEEFFHGGIVKQSIQDGSKSFIHQGMPWEVVLGGTQFDNLNLIDGWLYFTSVEDRAEKGTFSSIYRIRTDGTDLSLLYESQCWWIGKIHKMVVVDDTIYFVPQFEKGKAPCLMSMSIDGNNLKLLHENVFYQPLMSDVSLNVFGRQLLLKNSYNADSILSYDIDSGKKDIIKIEKLPSHRAGYLQISSEGRIYITMENESSLYHFTLNDTTAKKFDSDYGYYTVVEDKLLYYNNEDGNIYLRTLAGKGSITKITDKKVSKAFAYHNGWLYACNAENYKEVLFYAVPGVSQTVTPPTPTDNQVFSDVPPNTWYADPVAWAVDKGITNGTSSTKFSPTQDCTQAQILTFLYRAVRGEGEPTAADMDKAIGWAREKGMIDNNFNGNTPCTRATAVSYIWQAFNKPTAKASSFTDVPANAAYAKAVNWAVEKGITKGDGSESTFAPDKVCT